MDRSRAKYGLGRPAYTPLGRPAKGVLCSVRDGKNLRVGYKDYLQLCERICQEKVRRRDCYKKKIIKGEERKERKEEKNIYI